jgi:hypothetical protein
MFLPYVKLSLPRGLSAKSSLSQNFLDASKINYSVDFAAMLWFATVIQANGR